MSSFSFRSCASLYFFAFEELTLNGFQIGEFVHLDRGGRTGVLIVYVVSGYVQMGPFGSECVRACSRLCEFVHMFLHGVSKWR